MGFTEEFVLRLREHYDNPVRELIEKSRDEAILIVADGDYAAADVISLISLCHELDRNLKQALNYIEYHACPQVSEGE